VNMALLRLLGQREGDIIGKPFTTILRDSAVLNGPAWRRFLESGTLKNFELSYVTKRGESVPMNFNGSLMPDEQGGTRSIVGVAHDVREIKRLMADIERRRSETEQARYDAEFQQSRLMFLLSSLNEGVVMFDTRGEIVIINPVARRFFRFGADEEVTREKLKKVSWLKLDDMMMETSAGEQNTSINEAEIDFPVPQVIRTALTEVRANDGRLIGVLMVLQDVTEERHLDRMRDEFVVTVSHDLRTPLTTIKGFISLLLAEKVGKLTDKQRKFLKYADESSQHLHELINDLLDLSKIRAGKLVVDIESIDLRKVAEESIHLYKPAADSKGVALNLLTTGDPCIVEADFERMKEALNNLIGNALKFTAKNGEIIIEVLDYPDEGEIRVKDTGSGIANKNVGVIFEKFRSIPGKGVDEVLSTGIGLSIVKGIVEAHQGKVWVESEVGRGSTFFIQVPKKHA
jgi:PAS domain S-box-containing protein